MWNQVKEVVLETAEDDIEEIPHLPGLPSVIHRDGPGEKFLQNLDLLLHCQSEMELLKQFQPGGEMMGGKKSAFMERSSLSSETDEEGSLGAGDPPGQRPPSSRFVILSECSRTPFLPPWESKLRCAFFQILKVYRKNVEWGTTWSVVNMFQRKSSCFSDTEKSLMERPDRAWRNLDYLILFNSTKRISRSGRQTIDCNCVICSMFLFLLCHTSGTQSKKFKLFTGKV